MASKKAMETAQKWHEHNGGTYGRVIQEMRAERLATLIDEGVAELVDAVQVSVDEMYCTKTKGHITTEYCAALFEYDEWCGQCKIEAAAESWKVSD